MKIKNIFAALAAVYTLGFVSCDEDFEPTYLADLQVSSSYIAINPDGGSTTIDIKANGEWAITGAPEWLTVSPSTGVGSTTVAFAAESSLDGRTAELTLTCGEETQIINVIQGLATVSPATVKEIMEGPDKTYRVTGVVTKIAEFATYGNFYLNDGTSDVDLYIYGTLYNGQTKQGAITKLGIEVGDEVTIEGPKTVYGSTVELVDVTVLNVNKSLIKVEDVDPEDGNLSSDGGDFTVNLTCKTSNGITAEVPADAQEWLSIKAIKGSTVVFHAAANTAGPRSTTLTFSTTDGKKNYSAETTVSQDGLSGTLDLPMTPEEAIAAANKGVTAAVYVKGIVSQLVSGGYGAQYGNGSFWISADGTYNEDLALDFEVYQANWLGAQKWVEGNAQIAEGVEVIVYGPLTVYKGTAETQGKGAAYVYSVNGVTSDENGIGTLESPFKPAGACVAANAGTTAKVYVAGKISELVSGGMSAQYGNGSFWMSEDGVKHGDLSLDFEAYQVNWLGGEKWVEETHPQIEVGADVVIYGPLTVYKGTAETQGKGAAYVYSYNGATE